MDPVESKTSEMDEEEIKKVVQNEPEEVAVTSESPDEYVAVKKEADAGSRASANQGSVFYCSFDGCWESFDRPYRLRQHERSHRNEVHNL